MRRLVVTLAVALLAAGCASFSATKTDNTNYKPTDPDSVEILSAQPKREFVRIGEVRASGETISSRENMIQRLKEDAANMGGDAIIMKVTETEPQLLKDGKDIKSTYVLDFNKMYMPRMQGIVIKYKDTKK